jgi:hypothetical protein
MSQQLAIVVTALLAGCANRPPATPSAPAPAPPQVTEPAPAQPPAHSLGVVAAPGDRRTSQGSLALAEYDREGAELWYTRPSRADIEARLAESAEPLSLFDSELSIELPAAGRLTPAAPGDGFAGYELALAIDRARGIFDAGSELQYAAGGPWRLRRVHEGLHRGLYVLILVQSAATASGPRLGRTVALFGDRHQHVAIAAAFTLEIDQAAIDMLLGALMSTRWQRTQPIELPAIDTSYLVGRIDGVNISIDGAGRCELIWIGSQERLPAGSDCAALAPILARAATKQALAALEVRHNSPAEVIEAVRAMLGDAGLRVHELPPRVRVTVHGRDEVEIGGVGRLRGQDAFRALVQIHRDVPNAYVELRLGSSGSSRHFERVARAVRRAEAAAKE